MPSNHVYDIVEDNKGFLWLTSDNGVTRFDGKYFQNFSVKDGLPSNDVLQVIKEQDGTIWVNCYMQLPTYFDELNNKFISIKNHPFINELSKSLLSVNTLPTGGVKFFSPNGYVILKNKKVHVYSKEETFSQNYNLDKSEYTLNSEAQKLINNYYYLPVIFKKKNKIVDQIKVKSSKPFTRRFINGNDFYLFSLDGSFYKISYQLKPRFSYKIDTVKISENIANLKFSDNYLSIIGTKGNIYIYDSHNLKLYTVLNNQAVSNCVYVDKLNNIWISTLDKGLEYYSKTSLKTIPISENNVTNNFLSITAHNNSILAGNYYGELFQIKNNKLIDRKNLDNAQQAWIRKILTTKKDIIIVSDMGYSKNFSPFVKIYDENKIRALLKSGIAINDSLIIIGTINGLVGLNPLNGKTKILNSPQERSLNLTMGSKNSVYYIGPKGLYKYNIVKNSTTFPTPSANNNTKKFTTLTYAADSTLWLSTTDGSLVILKNEQVLATISYDKGLHENVNCMLAAQNKIWIGSKSGISIISYKIQNGQLLYSIKNLSKTDGLPSNSINDFSLKNDTIYAATENGIAVIPTNYKSQAFTIKPQLTDVKINQETVSIDKNYNLNSNQNNIALQFAGIELGGHFKKLQYSINTKTNWNNLLSNTLNLQLSSGKNNIYIRAVDVNNSVSGQILQLNFFIKTPYYKTKWFWALIAFLLTGITFWIYNRNKLIKQKNLFIQQLALAQQRNKITADLHDDIGASLSSLQLNSAVANQLLNNDVQKAKKMLNKIENQAKNLADKIGDIIWSMKPGKDEFMTISSRIKNFANDILSATEINYKIEIDNTLNSLIQDITTRKNLVLITKEAVNNVVKYSKANQLSIILKRENKNILLQIKDNGIGFEQTQQLGNGLENMCKRAKELKGDFKIESELTKGTTISVTIPLIP